MPSLKSRLPTRTLLQRGDLALSYKARDTRLDRDVFVKVLNPALADDAEIRARFEREAKAVARLDHPNLVRIYEYGQDADEGMYMLFEWVEGINLGQYLKTHGRLAEHELRTLAHDLLAGIAALHSVGIVHRDLKPENVLVAGNGKPHFKITDFSLAALQDSPTLTHHEAIVGTPAYMSPEQAAGARVTEKTDLFALGVLLYEAATGENPFVSHSMLDTMRRIRESDISLAHSKILALSPPLRSLIESLLRKEPDRRPESAGVALDLLSRNQVATPAPPPRKKSYSLFYLAAALAAVVLFILLTPNKVIDPITNSTAPIQPAIDSSQSPIVSNDTTQGTKPALSEPTPPRRDTTALKTKEPPAQIAVKDSTPVNIGAAPALPDSVDLYLTTEPWANVYFDGNMLGTTPLERPLRLPAGKQIVTLKNPAFPELNLPFNLNSSTRHETVKLSEHTALVKLNVEPWGECFVDGDSKGATPLSQPLYLAPGRHSLRIVHPNFPAMVRNVAALEGSTLAIHVDFAKGEFVANGVTIPQ